MTGTGQRARRVGSSSGKYPYVFRTQSPGPRCALARSREPARSRPPIRRTCRAVAMYKSSGPPLRLVRTRGNQVPVPVGDTEPSLPAVEGWSAVRGGGYDAHVDRASAVIMTWEGVGLGALWSATRRDKYSVEACVQAEENRTGAGRRDGPCRWRKSAVQE